MKILVKFALKLIMNSTFPWDQVNILPTELLD